MRFYLPALTALLLLTGCGPGPDAPLVPKLSAFTTAQQQCSDFLDGKEELTTDIEKECNDFLKRLDTANTTAHELESNKLKKGEREQKKLTYARQRNKLKQVYNTLSLSVKKATLDAIKKDNVKAFSNGIAFPGNTFISEYYTYMKSKAPLFDKNVQYLDYKKKMGEKLMKKGEYLQKEGQKDKALKLFVEAAEMGNAQAARAAGIIYEEQDSAKALKWHQIAVDGGATASYLNLGRLYENKGDKATALKWYLKAAVEGDAKAQYQLYNFYVNSDKKKAAYWLEKSANNGYAQAQFTYAKILMAKGDTDKAIDLLQKASQNNLTPASDYLGKYYYDLKLYQRAFKQLRQSKSANAFYIQAKMFEEGAGCDKNYAEAYTYYARAASLGKKEATKDMQRVNALLDSEQQRLAMEEEKARKEKMEKVVSVCGEIPSPENVKKKNKRFHLIGTASAPVGKRSYVIFGDDGEDYYVQKTRGIQENDKVDISVMSKGSTAELFTSEGDAYDVYQFIYSKPCVVEDEQ